METITEKKPIILQPDLLIDQPVEIPIKPKVDPTTHFDDLMAIKNAKANREGVEKRLFFFIGLTLSLLIVLFAFEYKVSETAPLIILEGGNNEIEMMAEIPLTEQPPPPPPAIQNIPQIITEVANDEEVIEDLKVEIDVEATADMTVEEVVFEEVEIEEEVVEQVFNIVEQYPEPVGGYAAFYQFLNSNLRYPKDALRDKVEGKVFVQFVIEKNGTLTNFKVMKGIGSGCDEEAIRVLQTVPNWVPGRQRGNNVRVYRTIPIIFKMAYQ
jgi:protein TonB